MTNNQRKKSEPTLDDLVTAVTRMDDAEKDSKDYVNNRKLVLKLINHFNSEFYQGYVSISKTRSLIQHITQVRKGNVNR